MIPQLLGTTALVAALPRKTVAVGNLIADGRVALVGAMRSGIERLADMQALSPSDATLAKKDLATLRRRADAGWSSGEEYRAAGGVLTALALGTCEAGLKKIDDMLSQ